MSELDKGQTNIGIYVESKEGERWSLSSNNANVRSPSLNFTKITSEKMQLDYLAKILVDIFLEKKRNARRK